MKNLQEIIAEVNRYNGTDDRVICTWFRWGEIKLLVDLLRSNRPFVAQQSDDNFLDDKLDEILPNEIEMLEDLSEVMKATPPKFTRHFENGVWGDCDCIECKRERKQKVDKQGYKDSSWTEKQIMELLTEIAKNTKPRTSPLGI